MIGAILGDIIGSPYELEENNIKTVHFPLFRKVSHFTDDTVMTIAVYQGLKESYGKTDEEIVSSLRENMRKYGRKYPGCGYGSRFEAWLYQDTEESYGSYGNGSAMRASPCAYFASSLEEARKLGRLSALPTHNHPEGVKGAEAIVSLVYLARQGKPKEEIKDYCEKCFYRLPFTLNEIRPTYPFNVSCQGSVPEAIEAFLEGKDYESTVRLAVSIGGDSDTIADMAGALAGAYYGIDKRLYEMGKPYLPLEFQKILNEFNLKYPTLKSRSFRS